MSVQSMVRSYQKNDVVSATPLRLIVMVYDRAILGCQQRNIEMAWKAIKVLIDNLNMDIQPLAGRLLAIYEYCNELMRNGEFDSACKILKELRDTWASLNNKI
ncbi:MAG: flagellar export chaperone FliS [bacterium]